MNTDSVMESIDRHQLYKDFQDKFPIDALGKMTLEQYTNLDKSSSFCYWIESKLYPLGSIWGGSARKFGIYRFKNNPEGDKKCNHDDRYAWYAKYNADTAQKAFVIVRGTVVRIASLAREGKLEEIDAITELGNVYKWKIAFLYSDEKLIPYYSQDMLKTLCQHFGMENFNTAKISEMQRFLIKQKGDEDVYVFADKMKVVIDEAQEQAGTRVWLYAPGENAKMWSRCKEQSVMCIGWDEMGDFMQYSSRKKVVETMREIYNKPNNDFRNDSTAVWNFSHTIKPGDIVIVKSGRNKILGRGIVESDYYIDELTDAYKNCRKVKWTHIGEWYTSGKTVMKTLTDISADKYPDYAKKLESLITSTTTSVGEKGYWWVVANPNVFSIANMLVGEAQEWTLYNDNGKKRGRFQNFLDARKGDVVIGYESTPVLQIVSLLEVSREADDKTIEFRKMETLGTPIDYAMIKDIPELQGMEFIKNHMGTFFKVSSDEADILMDMIREVNPTSPKPLELPAYTKDSFLQEVYMSGNDYDKLRSLLEAKKNVILQGAPGVGKTFAAKRLAYSMLEVKDKEKVEMIQFHQNYSYEDFIMGYKPTEDGGFALKKGVFYNFCKKAHADREHPYFFIIDEINRSNLSKIFGELLMLIENDYRDKPIKLAYNGEMFSVPSNLYIIGMMNTADRSLALMDYALRRRFAFFKMKPAFQSDGFGKYKQNLASEMFNKAIDAVEDLNKTIQNDDSLGEGFCIGHSYFCGQETFSKSWLDNVIRYDIVPMLEEYWFDNKAKCDQETDKLIHLLDD